MNNLSISNSPLFIRRFNGQIQRFSQSCKVQISINLWKCLAASIECLFCEVTHTLIPWQYWDLEVAIEFSRTLFQYELAILIALYISYTLRTFDHGRAFHREGQSTWLQYLWTSLTLGFELMSQDENGKVVSWCVAFVFARHTRDLDWLPLPHVREHGVHSATCHLNDQDHQHLKIRAWIGT